MRYTLSIAGMRCNGCARHIGESLRNVKSVTSVDVSFSPPVANVRTDAPISEQFLLDAVSRAGSYVAKVAEPSGWHPSEGSAGEAVRAVGEGTNEGKRESLYPLGLIVGYLVLVCLLAEAGRGVLSWHAVMNNFMAGFFLVFSFFKLLDVRGFADAYQTYDLLAKRSRAYALAYPFLELGLGVAYLLAWQPQAMHAITLVLMLFGAAGVATALKRGTRLRCACLGTALNLPMTSVTLIEDLTMAGMAAAGLLWPTPMR
jgi:copper chaperone CopZ